MELATDMKVASHFLHWTKSGCKVKMEDQQVMAFTILLAPLCNKREKVLDFWKEVCNVSVAKEFVRGWHSR